MLKSLRGGTHLQFRYWGDRGRWIPGAKESSLIGESFCQWEPLCQNTRWSALQEWHPKLSFDLYFHNMPTHMCAYTYTPRDRCMSRHTDTQCIQMFVHHHAHVEVRGQLGGLGSFLLPCGSQGTNSRHQTWFTQKIFGGSEKSITSDIMAMLTLECNTLLRTWWWSRCQQTFCTCL